MSPFWRLEFWGGSKIFLWQFAHPWLQGCQIRHSHCGVAENLYLLECEAMSGPRHFQGTCVYFLHLRCWSSKKRLEFFTAWPLNKNTLGSFETSRTIHPKTKCHIWEDLNHYIWDTLPRWMWRLRSLPLGWVTVCWPKNQVAVYNTVCEKLRVFRGLKEKPLIRDAFAT